MDIVIATRNPDKFKEMVKLLGCIDVIQFKSLIDYQNAPEVIEDGKSYEENASKKALTYAKFTGCLTIADDSGLEVRVLNGAPGILSARYAGKNATYHDNNKKLLRLLSDIPPVRRKAVFHSCIAIADSSGSVTIVKGDCKGMIADGERGDNGFGYDPLFIPDKFKKTFGEMSPITKNRISHRAMALKRARRILLDCIGNYITTDEHR